MKNLVILLILLVNNIYSQNIIKELPIKFNIYLDNKKIESNSVLIKVNNNDYTKITDSFTTFLLPNKTYSITITHPHYNKTLIKLNTAILRLDNSLVDIYLYSNKEDLYIKDLKYNKLLKKYIIYE